jgi:hypothetical protein
MWLRTDGLRGNLDQPPKPSRVGAEPRGQLSERTLEVSSRGLPAPTRVEAMKRPRGMRVELACGHVVRLGADKVRLAVDPGELDCPEGHGKRRVTPGSIVKAKARLLAG